MRLKTCLMLTFLLTAANYAVGANPSSSPISFDREIRPILAEKCLGCHGNDKPQGGLRLGDRDAALRGGESGAASLVPGKPNESEVIRRILSNDEAERMPPKEKEPLKPEEIAKLRTWIEQGANWSSHWAFQPVVRHAPPDVKATSLVRNEIDRFIIATLEQKGIAPSPEADRYTLIRRLSYDLIGLPPTVAEVDDFVNDKSDEAYNRVVERLLKSPHFGERWGRHWLDLAHYADSDGYEKDRARPDAYLYRDWVIDSLNRDQPFDQFTREQLAGDLLPNSTAKQKIGTGFLRQTLTNEEGGVDQEEYRVAAVFDRTETVGTVWMGLTIGCVRCHSHKYDPIPHDDYYRLFAFFNNADEVSPKLAVSASDADALDAELYPLEQALAAREAELAPASRAWEAEQYQTILKQTNTDLREHALEKFDVVSASAGANSFLVRDGEAKPTVPDKDTYVATATTDIERITGIKMYCLADESLPGKGPGRSPNGNFVLTGFQVFVVAEGSPDQPVELHRAAADFSQQKFSADAPIRNPESTTSGWAIAPKSGENHWIQFRTKQPLTLPKGAQLKVVIHQQYGGQHLIGRFKLVVLTGAERGLHITNKEVADALEMYPEKRVARTKEMLFDHFVRNVAKDERAIELAKQIDQVNAKHKAKLTEVRTIAAPRLARTTRVFDRGEFLSPKNEVHSGVPSVLAGFHTRSANGDRLDLANWLVGPENPLTARVAANHIWKHLFGQGLVRTLNDFGVRGEVPSHPELLDWLASRFRDDLHWSRKDLIRVIVQSATYRQSSHFRSELSNVDGTNVWLSHQNRFRVEAETVRDIHLAVSGLLTRKIGGPSVFPPMPDDLAKLSYANSFSWKNSEGEDRFRRGMYTFFKRTIPHPNLMTFDCPDANVACVARASSNTPLQALTLLNNESHMEASLAFAKKLREANSSDDKRIESAIRSSVSRPADAKEVVALKSVLAASRKYFDAHREDAAKVSGQKEGDANAVELAAWVSVARVTLNTDELITRE